MTDIVERLNEHDWHLGRSIAYEAADEIERLRSALRACEAVPLPQEVRSIVRAALSAQKEEEA